MNYNVYLNCSLTQMFNKQRFFSFTAQNLLFIAAKASIYCQLCCARQSMINIGDVMLSDDLHSNALQP